MKIRLLSPTDESASRSWDEFVMTCPAATFFHRSGWQRVIKRAFKHDTYFLFAERDACVCGVLPLAHIRSFIFGQSLVSLPFAVYGGPVANDDVVAQELEFESQMLAQRLGARLLEFRNVVRRHDDWPQQNLYVTFRKSISSNPDWNMTAIPRKQRAMVRKGIKNGLSSVEECSPATFFGLYADNVHRHGTPAFSKRYFELLLDEFKGDCTILTVRSADREPLSSVLSFHFRSEVLPYYAGDNIQARALAANDFKYWELMRRAAVRGASVFDFGRSKLDSGSYAYKKNWGFEPKPLHYEYCLYKRDSIPQNNPTNKKFGLLIEAWRRLPIGVANWLGPHIVRNLG